MPRIQKSELSLPGSPVRCTAIHARKLPRKVVAQRAVSTDLQVLRGEALDGPHDAQLPLRTVAHNDHLVEFRNLLFEDDMEIDPAADHDFLHLVADEAEAQNAFLVGDIDEETAFSIGRNALRGAFEQDRNADHRLFSLINDQAVNRDRSRPKPPPQTETGRGQTALRVYNKVEFFAYSGWFRLLLLD